MYRFLIATTYGYDVKSDDPGYIKLKKACSRRAYLDLARVVPYKYSVSKVVEYSKNKEMENEIISFQEIKKAFLDKIENKLIEKKEIKSAQEIICSVFLSAKEYNDKVFSESVNCSNNEPFTYGMAQKWVNMYYKYLWLFSYSEDCIKDCLDFPKELDMPIDSYIIDALFEEGILSEEVCNDEKTPLRDLIVTKNRKIKKTGRTSESILKWSGWNCEIYNEVQKHIKKKCSTMKKHILEFENDLWLKRVTEEK